MKKIILFIIVFFGMVPLMHKGKLNLINTAAVYAQSYAQEDCDPSDPNGDCYCDPNDPNGDCYDDPCKDGYSDNYATTTSLSGNITTTIKTWDNYDGCDNYLGQGTDDPGVDCGISDASISVSPNSGNYGDAVLLTARANIVGSTALHYEIQQSSDGGNSWDDVGNDSGSNSFSYKIDEYGENDFRVIVSCDCSISVTSASQSFMAAPDCPINSVSISLSPATGPKGTAVLLTGTADVNSTSTLQYRFQMSSDGGTTWDDVGNDPTKNTFSYKIDEDGESDFRVIVSTASCPTPTISSIASFTVVSSCNASASPITISQESTSFRYTMQSFDWGYTDDESVDIRIGACNDGTNWHAVILSVNGVYSERVRLLDNVSEVTGINGNTTEGNYCKQIQDLLALGGNGATWYVLTAVKAHEDKHVTHLLSSLQIVFPQIKTLIEGFSVPATGQDEETAIAQIEALSTYQTAKEQARTLWDAPFSHLCDIDHKEGAAATAEQNIVNPIISSICGHSHSVSPPWTPCTSCP
jgi:hypothetical protein